MADPADEQAVLDYLGGNQPLATQRLTTLPSASAAGGGTVAPALALPGGAGPTAAADTGGGLTGGVTGGGSIAQPGPSTASIVSSAGQKALDLAKRAIGSAPDEQARGGTGGTSLSDQVRSAATVASPSESIAVTGDEVITPGALAGTGLSGETAGGLSVGFGPNQFGAGSAAAGEATASLAEGGAQVGEQVAQDAAIESLELILPSIAETLTGVGFAIPLLSGIWNSDAFSTRGLIDLFHPTDPFKETKDIRKNFTTGFPILEGASQNMGRFSGLAGQSPEQQTQTLLTIAQQSGYEIDQAPAISQFMSTEGGKRKGLVSPLDVSSYGQVTAPLEADALLSSVVAHDMLAQRGAFPTDLTGSTIRNPMGESVINTISQLGESAGIPASTFRNPNPTQQIIDGQMQDVQAPPPRPLTDAETTGLQTPGQVIPTLISIFTSVNPNFASTELGQKLAAIMAGSGMGGAPTTGAAPQAQDAIQSDTAPAPAPQAPPQAPAPVMPSGPSGALGFASDMLGQ